MFYLRTVHREIINIEGGDKWYSNLCYISHRKKVGQVTRENIQILRLKFLIHQYN